MVTGVLAAGSMIAVMFEVKKWYKEGLANKALDKAKDGGDSLGLDKIGDSVNPSLTFTTWFYIAVVAFLAAAFFCYKRMQSSNALK